MGGGGRGNSRAPQDPLAAPLLSMFFACLFISAGVRPKCVLVGACRNEGNH